MFHIMITIATDASLGFCSSLKVNCKNRIQIPGSYIYVHVQVDTVRKMSLSCKNENKVF